MRRNSKDEEYDIEPDIYFPTGKRKKRSKEEQIYGIFGETEVEPEPELKGMGSFISFVKSTEPQKQQTSNKPMVVENDPLVTGLDSEPEEEPESVPKKFQFTKSTLPKEFGARTSKEAMACLVLLIS